MFVKTIRSLNSSCKVIFLNSMSKKNLKNSYKLILICFFVPFFQSCIRHYCLAAQEPSFSGFETKYIDKLKIVEGTEQIPIYRLVNVDGTLLNASEFPSVSTQTRS